MGSESKSILGGVKKILRRKDWSDSVARSAGIYSSSSKISASTQMKSIKALPLIGGWGFARQFLVLFGLALFFAILSFSLNRYFAKQVVDDEAQIAVLDELGAFLSPIDESVLLAAEGNSNVIQFLKETSALVDVQVDFLVSGGGASEEVNNFHTLKTNWGNIREIILSLIKSEGYTKQLAGSASNTAISSNVMVSLLENDINKLKSDQGSVFLLAPYAKMQFYLTRISKNAEVFKKYNQQSWTRAWVEIGQDNASLIDLWRQVNEAISGKPIAKVLQTTPQVFATYESVVMNLNGLGGGFEKIVNASGLEKMQDLKSATLAVIGSLKSSKQKDKKEAGSIHGVTLTPGVLSVLFLFLLVLVINRRTTLQALEAQIVNEQIQQSIAILMDDLDEISRGNLKHRATVGHADLGTLADSINRMVEELSAMVKGVKETAKSTREASEKALLATTSLIESTEEQSRGVVEGGKQVLKLSEAVNEVSLRASESADVAQRALSAANKGGEAVQSSQRGMHSIRQRVEEAGKRVQRVTESSKEIGGIVGLMTEMSEQTAVLAVNASVQAAKAGEAGKGFKVVAEGVQQLAEKSGESSRRVEALVKTALEDIAAALDAVSKTVEETKSGTHLADITNEALNTIVDFSVQLAELMSDISEQTSGQAKVAAFLSKNTQQALETASKATGQTKIASDSVQKVSESVDKLNESVMGFHV